MNVFSTGRLLVLSMTLLLGCRSEKAAFDFRPGPVVAIAAAPVAAQPAPAPAKAPAEIPASASTQQPAATRSVAVQRANPVRILRPQLKREAQSSQLRKAKKQPLQAASRHDVFHIVLGSLLIAGGVVAGLLLGGWLGLGVGAAVVILGYYFLVLGVGGKHAWLEIFQEFFNM
ncbi:hypothetical protein [Hymenobacter lucidus]|uniref:Uncharacterized protein n=1 Tax=Hymenobacter lucidus TaxID=2880930 RepID=A0ABS8ALU9_9BACT|nr:hypothetical protein [Hymenobacter lucidus]MCB2406623.1 hypothetical protein [Hymenobacter lucidus]